MTDHAIDLAALRAAVRDLTASNAHSLALLAACEARAAGLARTASELRLDERRAAAAWLRRFAVLQTYTMCADLLEAAAVAIEYGEPTRDAS